MFAPRYFTRSYWPGRYWPPVVAVAAGPPGPGDLVTTAPAWFRRRATTANGRVRRSATTSMALVRRAATAGDAER